MPEEQHLYAEKLIRIFKINTKNESTNFIRVELCLGESERVCQLRQGYRPLGCEGKATVF